MAECLNAHPEHDTACEITSRNHKTCTGWNEPLGTYLDWANPGFVAARTTSRVAAAQELAEMADRVAPPIRAADMAPTAVEVPVSGFSAGLAGSEAAAERWDDVQKDMVDDAILAVARRHAGGGEFTTDEVWAQIAGAVPVTKGMTARLTTAMRDGLLENTGRTEISQRGGEHDHGQRLTVWRSLIKKVG